jgi:hypothetical protein
MLMNDRRCDGIVRRPLKVVGNSGICGTDPGQLPDQFAQTMEVPLLDSFNRRANFTMRKIPDDLRDILMREVQVFRCKDIGAGVGFEQEAAPDKLRSASDCRHFQRNLD